MLAELTVKEFLAKTSSSDPVPGGGSISALSGALSASLAAMVAGLTLGRKKYEDKQERMEQIVARATEQANRLADLIDRDADAYNMVFDAFKLPKETDEQKAARRQAIDKATMHAIEVPMQVARESFSLMEMIREVATDGNSNAVTDAGVAAMTARTAVMGAILNVKVNLFSLAETEELRSILDEADKLVSDAIQAEKEILQVVESKLS